MLREKLTGSTIHLTTKEERISRALLANFPVAGMTTVSGLAARAGVSVPTVLRFVSKLGYSGYPAFQEALVQEVSEKLNSPLSLFSNRMAEGKPSFYQGTMKVLSEALAQTGADYRDRDFEAVLDLLDDHRTEVHCLGGRFSSTVAQRLALHLAQIRPGIRQPASNAIELADQLVDYNNRTTLIVFDFRRYQDETIRFARLAHEAGARIVLFTDRWLSPINTFAEHTLVSPVESLSPFDSWIPAVAQTEAIVAALAGRNPDRVRERLAKIETLRSKFRTGEDKPA